MSLSYDKTVCLGNIKTRAKQLNLKIGDIEQKAGISPGYLSRVAKEGNDVNISIDTLYSISKILNLPLDILLSYDLTGLSTSENQLMEFLNKLISRTMDDTLAWDFEKAENVYDYNFYFKFPFMNNDGGEVYYFSTFSHEYYAIEENVFWTQISGDSKVYILKVTDNKRGKKGFDIHLSCTGRLSSLYSTVVGEKDVFNSLFEKLYKLIHFQMFEPKMDGEAGSVIQSFIEH